VAESIGKAVVCSSKPKILKLMKPINSWKTALHIKRTWILVWVAVYSFLLFFHGRSTKQGDLDLFGMSGVFSVVALFILGLTIAATVKTAESKGRREGFGNPKEPEDTLADFDSVLILKRYSSGLSFLCLVEIVYIKFPKSGIDAADLRERRFYRVRVKHGGEMTLQDQRDELERAEQGE
jgi:hypothetical protein